MKFQAIPTSIIISNVDQLNEGNLRTGHNRFQESEGSHVANQINCNLKLLDKTVSDAGG